MCSPVPRSATAALPCPPLAVGVGLLRCSWAQLHDAGCCARHWASTSIGQHFMCTPGLFSNPNTTCSQHWQPSQAAQAQLPGQADLRQATCPGGAPQEQAGVWSANLSPRKHFACSTTPCGNRTASVRAQTRAVCSAGPLIGRHAAHVQECPEFSCLHTSQYSWWSTIPHFPHLHVLVPVGPRRLPQWEMPHAAWRCVAPQY
jgi:hypothetical protein